MKILDIQFVDIDKLTVSEENVRKIELNELSLSSLVESIKILGVVYPITITEDYEIVIGKRRWRACKLLWEKTGKEKFKKIPCFITRFDPRFGDDPRIEMAMASYIENKTKKMLTDDEEAEVITALAKKGLSRTKISKMTGNPRRIVDHYLKKEYLHDWNLKFENEAKEEVIQVVSNVSEDYARALGEAIAKERNLKLLGIQQREEETIEQENPLAPS